MPYGDGGPWIDGQPIAERRDAQKPHHIKNHPSPL